MSPNKLAVYFVADIFVADMVVADMVVADIDFPCGRYRLAVADMVLADMVCGRYGCTPLLMPGCRVGLRRSAPTYGKR